MKNTSEEAMIKRWEKLCDIKGQDVGCDVLDLAQTYNVYKSNIHICSRFEFQLS